MKKFRIAFIKLRIWILERFIADNNKANKNYEKSILKLEKKMNKFNLVGIIGKNNV